MNNEIIQPPVLQTYNDEAIYAADLCKYFDKQPAVKNVSFQVKQGEFFGFLGPNGAGKSTTIRMLCGMLPPDTGGARVAGYEVATQILELKRVVGVLPDEPQLYERLTGYEHLIFSGQMYGLTKSEADQRARQLLELMQLTGDYKKMIVDYSLGMKKKIALACALIHRPRVLFLDEPFNGIDPISVRVLRDAMHQMTQHGTTIFISSHVMEVVEKLCTRIAVINHGSIVGIGTVEELREMSESAEGSSLEDIFLKMVDARTDSGAFDWLQEG